MRCGFLIIKPQTALHHAVHCYLRYGAIMPFCRQFWCSLVNTPNAHCSYFLEAKLVADALEKERTQTVWWPCLLYMSTSWCYFFRFDVSKLYSIRAFFLKNFFLESFNLWHPFPIIAIYCQTKIPINFWCR